MDKGLLFQFMRVKFREAGFTDAEVELHMQSFSERYQNKTDEEIEADIKRRGGASRVAAATVERRNTVLMADADYRAFVASAKDTPKTEVSGAEKTEAPAAKPSSEPQITESSAPRETPDAVPQNQTDEDPLAAWFSVPAERREAPVERREAPVERREAPAEKQEKDDAGTPSDDAMPIFFGEPTSDQKPAPTRPAQAKPLAPDASTAEVPVVKPATVSVSKSGNAPAEKPVETSANHAPDQEVHTIPLFAQPAQGQPSAPKPQPRPNAQGAPVPPKTSADGDLGSTRVVGVPSAERAAKPMPAPQPPRPANKAYQDEQRAIWGGSSDIRDSRGPAPRPNAVPRQTDASRQTAAPHPQGSAGVHNAPKPHPHKTEKQKIEYADRGNVTWLQEKTYWGEGSEEGVRRFRIILGVSILPIAVLLLAYAVIALGLIVLMPVLMAVFVLGLVVEVAVGSLVALVAVIYGVSQLFIVMPVGMFELGLGVAAIGVTMFVGILMYNIAVRLLPFLLRQFIHFQSVFKGFLQDLYYYVKGECYRR